MNILYIEDDPAAVELTKRELARSAPLHRIESVGTIQAARELMNRASDRLDLILMGLNLPGGSRTDFLGYVRRRSLPLAVVVLVEAGEAERTAALLKAGAEDILVKAAGYLQHLVPILESALQRFRAESERRSRILNVIYADASAEDVDLVRLHLARFTPHIQIVPVSSPAEIDACLSSDSVSAPFDALVLDDHLPEANVFDLLRELYSIRRLTIPVLLLTRLGSEEVAVQALKLGAADYLIKTSGYFFRLPSAIENAVSRLQLVRDQVALREGEARYRRLAENAPDLIFRLLIKPERRFDFVSPAALKMTGYSPEEYYADPDLLERLVYPDDTPLLERLISGFVRPGEAVLMRCLHKDGRVIWVEQRVSYIYNLENDITALEGIARDVTGQREVETEMQRQLQRLASLRSIDQAISNSFDLNLVLVVLIDKVKSELKVDAASILLYNPVNQMLEHSAGSGYRSRLVDTLALRIGEAYAGLAMYERRLIHFPSTDLPAPSRDTARLMAEEGFASGACAPLITKGEVKGVLQVFSRALLKAETGWLGFLEVLANQAAIAIDNAEMFQQLQRSNHDLKQAYDAMLEGWVRAMEMRDREKNDHNRTVTRLALELAEWMRIDPEELSTIRRGSLLHDIGKLGIPDAILHKPAPLDEEEWKIMRLHPRLALEMLAPIPSLDKVLEIPYAHHEKWDGSGYPRGLQGDRIPFAARLFAIVDVWNALTTEKPYRPAWSKEKALEYIREQAGKHFDPAVAAAFLKKVPV